jgi:hypothetical protein
LKEGSCGKNETIPLTLPSPQGEREKILKLKEKFPPP